MIDLDQQQMASELRGSLLRFTQFFYPLLTGRQFVMSSPTSRESHFYTIAKSLTQASRLEIPQQRLLINTPPGSGKSTMLVMWTAWTLAQYPDSRYLYISYSKVLAAKHTESIKRIIQLPHYNYLFGVKIRHDSKAKEFFQTTSGGAVGAFGSGGAITGQDAGLPALSRFSGAVIIDDAHKPDEVYSDTIRESVINNYRDTIQQRARGINVPYIFIGQRLHEADLGAYLLDGKDGRKWQKVIIESIDAAGNSFYPEVYPIESLRIKEEHDPYVFASQFQQNPIPAGGALFKPDWFVLLDDEPELLMTFITADTAETSKSYNDATVFSFWGLYEIENLGIKTGQMGLHWIDCIELRVEPKDLKGEFVSFWQGCARHATPPMLAAIEKKSTGVTLISVLQEIRGIQVRDIQRTSASGSKAQRFLEIQPYVASKCISLPSYGHHTQMCIDHMVKITANDSHRWDDLCDTLADAVKIALIDKTIHYNTKHSTDIAAKILGNQKKSLNSRRILYGQQQS